MANPATAIIQLPSAVTNGISTAHTYGAAGAMTINGSLATAGVASLVVAQRVSAISDNAGDTTQSITITGTDRYGNRQGEVLALNGTTRVYSAKDYLTVTALSISAATAGNITVGTNTYGSTEWIFANMMITPVQITYNGQILSGTATYTIEYTLDDPNAPANAAGTALGYTAYPLADTIEFGSAVPPVAWPDATINAKSDNQIATLNAVIFAYRLTVTAGTGKVKLQGIQAGVRN